MTREIEQKLESTFPWFNVQCECGDGWQWIILDMLQEIDDYYFNLNRECEVLILQVKEKFGTLRIYTSCDDEDFEGLDEIIIKYEQLSKSTCEICGAKGEMLRDVYWITVRCEGCRI